MENKKLSLSPATQGGTRFTTTLQPITEADQQTDMRILKDRKRQKQGNHALEGSRCSHAHLAVQAGGWGHGLAYSTTGISISLVLHLCLPRCHLCWLSSLWSQGHQLLGLFGPKGNTSFMTTYTCSTGCIWSHGCVSALCMVLAVMLQVKCEPH